MYEDYFYGGSSLEFHIGGAGGGAEKLNKAGSEGSTYSLSLSYGTALIEGFLMRDQDTRIGSTCVSDLSRKCSQPCGAH